MPGAGRHSPGLPDGPVAVTVETSAAPESADRRGDKCTGQSPTRSLCNHAKQACGIAARLCRHHRGNRQGSNSLRADRGAFETQARAAVVSSSAAAGHLFNGQEPSQSCNSWCWHAGLWLVRVHVDGTRTGTSDTRLLVTQRSPARADSRFLNASSRCLTRVQRQ